MDSEGTGSIKRLSNSPYRSNSKKKMLRQSMPTSLRAFRTELSQAGVAAVNDSKSRRLKVKKQLDKPTTSRVNTD